jgi:hypothetical protein
MVKWELRKCNVLIWTGLLWLRKGYRDSLLQTRPAKWLFASHEGLLASNLAEAATILTYVLDVPGVNIGCYTDYPN